MKQKQGVIMFIQQLKKFENTDLAVPFVKRKVSYVQSRISKYDDPTLLKKFASNIYKVSKQHPLAKQGYF